MRQKDGYKRFEASRPEHAEGFKVYMGLEWYKGVTGLNKGI